MISQGSCVFSNTLFGLLNKFTFLDRIKSPLENAILATIAFFSGAGNDDLQPQKLLFYNMEGKEDQRPHKHVKCDFVPSSPNSCVCN